MNRARIAHGTLVLVVAALGIAACGGSDNNNSSAPSTASTPTQAATPTPTQAAPSQTVTIAPNKNLADGQKVRVVGKGYTAGQQYGVTECANKGTATGAGDCNLRGIKVGVANANGVVTVQFPVAKGPFGSNNIDCTKSPGCIVSVANAGTAAPTEVGAAPIKFAS